jgi:hypothetical protein
MKNKDLPDFRLSGINHSWFKGEQICKLLTQINVFENDFQLPT